MLENGSLPVSLAAAPLWLLEQPRRWPKSTAPVSPGTAPACWPARAHQIGLVGRGGENDGGEQQNRRRHPPATRLHRRSPGNSWLWIFRDVRAPGRWFCGLFRGNSRLRQAISRELPARRLASRRAGRAAAELGTGAPAITDEVLARRHPLRAIAARPASSSLVGANSSSPTKLVLIAPQPATATATSRVDHARPPACRPRRRIPPHPRNDLATGVPITPRLLWFATAEAPSGAPRTFAATFPGRLARGGTAEPGRRCCAPRRPWLHRARRDAPLPLVAAGDVYIRCTCVRAAAAARTLLTALRLKGLGRAGGHGFPTANAICAPRLRLPASTRRLLAGP